MEVLEVKKWKKVLIWTLSVIVVLGVGGLFAANYAVDRLMNSMAGGFEVEDTADNVAQGEVVEPVVAEGMILLHHHQQRQH